MACENINIEDDTDPTVQAYSMTVCWRVEATKAASMSDTVIRAELQQALKQMLDKYEEDRKDDDGLGYFDVSANGVTLNSILRSRQPFEQPQVVALQESVIPMNQQ
jgi:hypothetical protein